MRCSSLLLLLMTWMAYVAADVAPEPLMTGGNNISPKSQSADFRVEMSWEEVDLYPARGSNRCEAVFGMRNTGTDDVTMEVGFPSLYQVEMHDFKAWVDDQPIEAAYVKVPGYRGRFTSWMTWSMTFPAGKEVKIKVSYWTRPKREESYLHRELPETLRDRICKLNSGYVLRTGKGWHGPIGKGVVRIHHESCPREKLQITSAGDRQAWVYDANTNTSTHTFSQWEPAEWGSDVVYEYDLNTTEEQLTAYEESFAAGLIKNPFMQGQYFALLKTSTLDAAAKQQRALGALRSILPPKATLQLQQIAPGEITTISEYFRLYLALLAKAGQSAELATAIEAFEAFINDPAWQRCWNRREAEWQRYRQQDLAAIAKAREALPAR
jgi:hypothetical protein